MLDASAGLGTGGSIYVRAGTLTLDDSKILAGKNALGTGGTIALAGEHQLTLTNGALVGSFDFTEGGAVSIRLTGGDITIDQGSEIYTDILGSGGDVTVTADSLTITNGRTASATGGSGDGGDITVNVAGTLAITGDWVPWNPKTE